MNKKKFFFVKEKKETESINFYDQAPVIDEGLDKNAEWKKDLGKIVDKMAKKKSTKDN